MYYSIHSEMARFYPLFSKTEYLSLILQLTCLKKSVLSLILLDEVGEK